ncbi:MAG: hypothetical protein D6712_04415 [Chloroflexi bacterium]|nr:MAG: hypothetical protein D6712_04415 [Chloroflexota bacterium]
MYYPDQRYITRLTTIRRECLLPDDAIGKVVALDGTRVDIRDVVARGAVPRRHIIIEGQKFFGLKKPDALNALLLVKVGEAVDEGVPIAGKNPKRGKRIFAPVRGIVKAVTNGRIIMSEMPEIIDLEAGVKGRVVEVYPRRGVAIEAVGGLLQGVWGNGHRRISILREGPQEGLEFLGTEDVFGAGYRGSIVLSRRPLTAMGLQIAEEQNVHGVIVPSMDASLRPRALESEIAIFLTEGFGDMPMSTGVYSQLKDYNGRSILMDAYTPTGEAPRRPEIIINELSKERPPRPNFMLALRPGMGVRITREPHAGSLVRVVDLPKKPVLLDNGLRVPCARVELVSGDVIAVPLADLEYIGR